MVGWSLTAFDIGALIVIGLSVLVAVVRGAVRETLSLASWIGAAVIAYYGFGYARDLARQTIETDWLADAAALTMVFIVPLVGFKIVAAVLADHLPGGTVGVIDRTAGLAFGVARGAVIVSAAYLGLSLAIEPAEHPVWIQEAMVLPYVREGAELLNRFVPDEVAARSREAAASARDHGGMLGELGRSAAEELVR